MSDRSKPAPKEKGTSDADEGSSAPKRPEDTDSQGDAHNDTGEDNHSGSKR